VRDHPERLAAAMADPFGLVVLPLPLDAPAIGLDLYWHERAHDDAGNAWLRGELERLFAGPSRGKLPRVARIDLARRRKLTL
jgi:hypothetical protein